MKDWNGSLEEMLASLPSFEKMVNDIDKIIIKNTQWERDDTYPVEVVPIKPLIKYLRSKTNLEALKK